MAKSKSTSPPTVTPPTIRIAEPAGDRVCCSSLYPRVSGTATFSSPMTAVTASIGTGGAVSGTFGNFCFGAVCQSNWTVLDVGTVAAGSTAPANHTVTIIATFADGTTATQTQNFGAICPQMRPPVGRKPRSPAANFFLHLDHRLFDLEFQLVSQAQVLQTVPVRLRRDAGEAILTWRGAGKLKKVWTLTAQPISGGDFLATLELSTKVGNIPLVIRWLGFPFSPRTGGDLHPETSASVTHFVVSRKRRRP